MSERTTMNKKPVFDVPAQTVINWQSGFGHKLLSDDLTFTTGSACAFSCSFCYVAAIMTKSPHMDAPKAQGLALEGVVIRRTGAVAAMREQILAVKRGHGKKLALFEPREKPVVIYASPLVDVAANRDLCDETIAACLTILELTPWDIRLLSKSNMLPRIAEAILPEWKHRMIYGVSTGTLDNKLAQAFEQGTALVSKRLQSLHELQDSGHRTFGMICPSLPQTDYLKFAEEMYQAIRGWKCEHVWAEAINVRGESMIRTVNALMEAGFVDEANALSRVSTDKDAWEEYSRRTFMGHSYHYAPGQLRFLQYVNARNKAWWEDKISVGAVLLGQGAMEGNV